MEERCHGQQLRRRPDAAEFASGGVNAEREGSPVGRRLEGIRFCAGLYNYWATGVGLLCGSARLAREPLELARYSNELKSELGSYKIHRAKRARYEPSELVAILVLLRRAGT
jgi:hypothetical protein